MKLIKPSVELIEQESGLEGIYKQIERAGRICYKSEDKITEDSAKKFVDMLIKNGHGAMLEHGTVYLKGACDGTFNYPFLRHFNNPYSKTNAAYVFGDSMPQLGVVTTNYRVLLENNWLDDLRYLCEPTEFHEKRYTLKFTTSIGITRELVRHRHMSFANESTRYVNYKNKGLEFIEPYWYDKFNEPCNNEGYRENGTTDMFDSREFIGFLDDCEKTYLCAIIAGAKPQEAREMLPLCTKSEIIMTGFESDWKDFFKLRCDKAAHPDMQIIANKANELLKF